MQSVLNMVNLNGGFIFNIIFLPGSLATGRWATSATSEVNLSSFAEFTKKRRIPSKRTPPINPTKFTAEIVWG